MHILTCSKCQTKFSVPKQALLPNGRKVRCGNCGNVWLELPEGVAPIKQGDESLNLQNVKDILSGASAEKKQSFTNPSNLPARKKDVQVIKASFLSQFLTLVLVILAFVLGVLVFSKSSSWFLELKYVFNLYDSSGLEIQKVDVIQNKDIQTMDLKIQVKNTTEKIKEVKFIRVTLLNSSSKVIREYVFEPDDNIISASSTKEINLSIFSPSESAFSVLVDIGNKWDFMFR
jgi:predicted Zn finger-like uncharacterized protein